MRSKGFSLVELIVVMTIIIVISTIALISYGSTNKKARDARRSSDLQKISIALEMARQIGSTYPANSGVLISAGYLQVWPTDPKGYAYVYSPAAAPAYTYNIYAYMEDLGSTNMSPLGNCSAPSSCNYTVINP